jgi:MoaA/NifB/PqqE/SkfB family radical SAM enzyme
MSKLRSMKNEFRGVVFYQSTFDPSTGTLVRSFAQPKTRRSYGDTMRSELFRKLGGREYDEGLRKAWEAKFGWREEAFSPSPETLDISITDWCDFGCTYCYQDSTARQKHAPKSIIETVLKSFAHAPYQIAIGGGEPTAHPDLPEMLFRARELGTVPNYTTAGHLFRQDVIDATNEVCGGIAMTFHAHRGIAWFEEHYARLRKALRVQVNVHVIADCDVAKNIDLLVDLQKKVGLLNVVLLAYYPDVGRGTLSRIMSKEVYGKLLPDALKRAIDAKMRIAFSEGLLPYFISRPEIGVSTTFASRSEGLFSAYVDPRGRMSHSSFDPPAKPQPDDTPEERRFLPKSVLEGESLQAVWNKGFGFRTGEAHGGRCYDCAERNRCATPSKHHYFACAFAEHNGGQPPLTADAKRDVEMRQVIKEMTDLEKKLGRKLTEEENKPFSERFALVMRTERED